MKVGGMFCYAFCLFLCVCKVVVAEEKLIVVLIDGMRWDYINDPKLKGFSRIADNGVRAPYVIPVYPSLSYPNYETIVTGLYPEEHSFVGNLLYDNITHSFFGMIPENGSTDPHWWNGAEPIWITAEKHGKKAALYWWAGCEVRIRGAHPSICERQRYGRPSRKLKLNFLQRIDDVIQMFKAPDTPPSDSLSLALMYYGSVDYVGHHLGPKSPNLKSTLLDIDEILDKMQSKLEEATLDGSVNIMVVADHGMTNIQKKISLEKFKSEIRYQVGSGAISMILPKAGMLDTFYQKLKSENIEGLTVYKKEDIPEEYHIKKNKLILPLFLRANKGYYIKGLKDSGKWLGGKPEEIVATHGYDPNETEDMRTIFLARGPAFREGFQTEVLHNTDLYNIMCNILDIQPLPNNGSLERVKPMLIKYAQHSSVYKSSAAQVGHHLYYFGIVFLAVYIKVLRQSSEY